MFFNIGVGNIHGGGFTKKRNPIQVLSYKYCKIFKNTYFEEHLQMAASILINIELIIKYWASANLFLIKNIT